MSPHSMKNDPTRIVFTSEDEVKAWNQLETVLEQLSLIDSKALTYLSGEQVFQAIKEVLLFARSFFVGEWKTHQFRTPEREISQTDTDPKSKDFGMVPRPRVKHLHRRPVLIPKDSQESRVIILAIDKMIEWLIQQQASLVRGDQIVPFNRDDLVQTILSEKEAISKDRDRLAFRLRKTMPIRKLAQQRRRTRNSRGKSNSRLS